MYGNFCSLDLCLHNQIVHDGISSLANVKDEMFMWEWGKENVRVPFSDKDLSEIRSAISEDILNSESLIQTTRPWLASLTSVTRRPWKDARDPLIFAFRASNAVLDPHRVWLTITEPGLSLVEQWCGESWPNTLYWNCIEKPTHPRAKAIYKASCWNCKDFYIGKIKRRLHDRKTEHFKALAKNDHTSAIAGHANTTGHNIKWDHFDIKAKKKTDYHYKIKETLLIQELRPAFNVNVSGEKLMLY